jgi:hypothetical protein
MKINTTKYINLVANEIKVLYLKPKGVQGGGVS